MNLKSFKEEKRKKEKKKGMLSNICKCNKGERLIKKSPFFVSFPKTITFKQVCKGRKVKKMCIRVC